MDITYLYRAEGSAIWQKKDYPKSHGLELDLDDFRLETTTKHLAVTVINYKINSLRNVVDCLLLEVLKSELHAA